jgi:hypothetical protein
MDTRGVYGFSSLMKQNKKAKNYAVFCFAGKKKLLLSLGGVGPVRGLRGGGRGGWCEEWARSG